MSAWLASFFASIVTKLASYYSSMLAWFIARWDAERDTMKRGDDAAKRIDEILAKPEPTTEEERLAREKELDDAMRDLLG
jgi:hypothetical protein